MDGWIFHLRVFLFVASLFLDRVNHKIYKGFLGLLQQEALVVFNGGDEKAKG